MALFCILIIHFNATVTGYFTLPNKLFANTVPFGIYLGDFGSSLFFIVSGAALALTSRDDQPVVQFYKKRAKAVYPLFWLSWCLVFALRFLAKPGYYAAAKTPTLLFTALGIDQFAVAAGFVTQNFACVGEWFLGTILFIYILFPLLQRGIKYRPWLCWGLVLAVCLPAHYFGLLNGLVAVHLPEFLFGMTFMRLARRDKLVLLPVLAVGLLVSWRFDSKIASALLGMLAFIALAWAARFLEYPWPRAVGAWLAKISYPVFLLHHVLILRMVEGFDLAALTRRDTAFLFLIYLALTAVAAEALLWLQKMLQRGWSALRPATPEA